MARPMNSLLFAAGSLGVTILLLRALFVHAIPARAPDQARVLQDASFVHLVLAGVTLAALTVLDNPMGKMMQPAKEGTKPTLLQRLSSEGIKVEARAAWIMQELPTLLAVLAHVLYFGGRPQDAAWTLRDVPLALFMLHYVHRVFVYPVATMRTSNAVPLGITLLANCYCCFNGRMQAGLFFLRDDAAPAGFEVNTLAAYFGTAVFLGGMAVNVSHDRMLAGLRKRGGRATANGYVIPRGGLFSVISAANLFGEIVEWAGYAIVCAAVAGPTGAAVGGAFAAYVFANLAPRCVATHRWYLDRFGDEFKKLRRSALIPGIF
eukprot:CAMPEP_0174833422 /NCGR_PEP_ID=MMETSP1114-20130205/4227_1 /TAXON_ID=312471 /ORGANISM="Neobodo designis, Strain CCAP 1951/1" /LENGTH=319 /DNA_ID=CAMNT_0016067305 /DNA_START=35 /DNA_END=994 /DNA_ORIENTATION=-